MYDVESRYPLGVDDLIFFEDVNLDGVQIMKRFNDLVAEKRYTEASNYIENQDVVFAHIAKLYNMIENRIYATQSHIDEIAKHKTNPHVYGSEPTDPYAGEIWCE